MNSEWSRPFDEATAAHPVMFVARNSGVQSDKARRDAARELAMTVDRTFAEDGFDARHVLPDLATIVDGLKASRKVKTPRRQGLAAMTHEFVVYDYESIVMIVATGTGTGLDADLNQPFVSFVSKELRDRQPSILVVNRFDRVGRAGAADSGPIISALLHHQGWIRDEEGARKMTPVQAVMGAFKAFSAGSEAGTIHKKTRQGISSKTGRVWTESGLPYAVVTEPPAGLCRMRMKSAVGGPGECRMFLDDPAHYPPADMVAYGRPAEGVPGTWSNVDCVMWALANLGKPGMSMSEVARVIMAQGFSSGALRRRHGPEATYTDVVSRHDQWRALRPIINRLDFYRTGELRVVLGHDEVPNFSITGIFPPGGKWANDADFERIAAFQKSTRGGGPATKPLVGVKVQTPLGPAILRSASARKSTCLYEVKLCDKEAGRLGYPAIPHDALAASIVTGLADAADQILIPVDAQMPAAAAELDQAVGVARQRVQELEGQVDALLDRISATGSDGTPILSETATRALDARLRKLITTELEPAKAAVAKLLADLEDAQRHWAEDHKGIEDNLLLRLVASLADPHDTEWNDLFKTAVEITSIGCENFVSYQHKGRRLTWSGTVCLHGAGQDFRIDFSGEYVVGSAAQVDGRVDKAIAWMLDGIPMPQMKGSASAHRLPQHDGVRMATGDRLGFPAGRFALGSCPHPRLVRIGIRLALSGRDTRAVAVELDEPLSMVEAVNANLESGLPHWARLAAKLGVA